MKKNNLTDSLYDVISSQETNYSKLEELEEAIAPACGCGCAEGVIC